MVPNKKIISTSTLTLHSLEVSKQASFQEPSSLWYRFILNICTLQGTNISHLGKRKIIDSKVLAGEGICSFPGGYMYSKQVYIYIYTYKNMYLELETTNNFLLFLNSYIFLIFRAEFCATSTFCQNDHISES